MTFRRRLATRVLGAHAHHAVRAWRATRRQMPVEPSRNLRVARRLVRANGLTVSGGPFDGLVLPRAAVGASLLSPKLLGSFECELHGVIEHVIGRQPSLVINVGSAEGYYAIGLALRLPHARVVAFDPDRDAQRLCLLAARDNGVSARVQQRGAATVQALAGLPIGSGTLLVVDCEGCEDALLDPLRLPGLRSATMIVELHEHLVAGVGDRLKERWRASHELAVIAASQRPDLDPAGPWAGWKDADRRALLDEGRPPSMSWLTLSPRCAGG